MRLERSELAGPHGIRLREPMSECCHGLRSQSIDTDAGIKLVASFIDETAAAEGLQMTAHRREGNAHDLRQLSCTMRPFPQEIDHAPAIRIGKGGKCSIEIGCTHFSLLNFNPVAASISPVETVRTVCEKVQ